MKVGKINHNINLSIESKPSKEKTNFNETLNLANKSKTKEDIDKQML